MTSSLELYQQAFEKVVETVNARREGLMQDFHYHASRGDGLLTQHEQGVLDAYDEVQMLVDSVQYELDQMLDHHTGIARPLEWQNVGC